MIASLPKPVELSDRTRGDLRVLLIICRPAGSVDVPFRSVASHLVRLSSDARRAFQLDVLRPPTFGELAQVLNAAKERGMPYHVVHFDGHGTYLDLVDIGAAAEGGVSASQANFSVVSPPRPGAHGFLVFEDPAAEGNQQLVDMDRPWARCWQRRMCGYLYSMPAEARTLTCQPSRISPRARN